jgi:hypothetical protein
MLSDGTPQEGREEGDGAGSRIGSPCEKSRGNGKAAKRDNDAGRREPPTGG